MSKTRIAVATTPRLFLAPLELDDAPQAFLWASDSEVTRFLRYSTHRDISDTLSWLKQACKCPNELGVFLVDGRLIGCVACAENSNSVWELGYNFNKNFWGKGYCTEAVLAALAYTAEHFGATEFCVSHAEQNFRSRRVIEKCGFVFDHDGTYSKFDGSETFANKNYKKHIDLHRMNLADEPFKSIADGSKTIEMRLDDERRKNIKVGDFVLFQNNDDGRKMAVVVKALHRFSNFAELYANMDLTKCGYTADNVAFARSEDMLQYYPQERQQQYGALGIEIQLLCVM